SEAEPLLRAALEVERERLGPNHPSVITDVHALSYCLAQQNKLDAAKPLALEALSFFRQVKGKDHHSVAMALRNVLDVMIRLREWEEARKLLDQLIDQS